MPTPCAHPITAIRWSTPRHIVGIALLFGGIVPLDLRLLGFWRSVPVETLARILVPIAITGLTAGGGDGLADVLGVGRQICGPGCISAQNAARACRHGQRLAAEPRARMERRWAGRQGIRLRVASAAGLSIALWLAVILCGRVVAYVD